MSLIKERDFDAEHMLRFFNEAVRVVNIDLRNGKVTVADGYTPDEASKVFWEAVERNFPGDWRSK